MSVCLQQTYNSVLAAAVHLPAARATSCELTISFVSECGLLTSKQLPCNGMHLTFAAIMHVHV